MESESIDEPFAREGHVERIRGCIEVPFLVEVEEVRWRPWRRGGSARVRVTIPREADEAVVWLTLGERLDIVAQVRIGS